ncbi:hypothetical protein DY000_02009603 [Brassica cretica]|uniref:Uncharacterized protein n=1 Tax=Brassica cretica TaxID=69181 RepID=A0ABQ7CCG9_BRACR|nr:hypothetical protein DY000_02009603 [Brassica cretica]
MNIDDDTVAETSTDIVAEVLFIEKREKKIQGSEPASIDGWPAYRSKEHHMYRSPLDCVD